MKKKYIIMHELCHYKRRDILVTWLTSIVKAIHWFNPIIYLGFNIMRSDCEAACDEMVLTKLGKEENLNYGNTIINVLQLIHSKNPIPGTTSMVTDKKRLKDRIKNIAENKKFGYGTIIAGIVVISVLAIVVLTTRLKSENLNLVDSSKISDVTIKVMSSPPRGKNIYNKEDVIKIVDYINSIKVKDEKQKVYKGWEINIKLTGEENYDISFIDNYININGIQYTTSNKAIDKIRILYDSMNYEERDIVSNEVIENGSLNFHSLVKQLMDKNIEIKLIEEKSLSTKDNGYSADFYTIKANNEEVKIYDYIDSKAAISEIGIFNGDDYSEINYASEYILIDIEELKSAENVYFKDSIICLYNGDSGEIKDSLAKILGEPLVKQSRDALRISDLDITLTYPSQWLGALEPVDLILGDESYKIDSRKVKLNKNVCELKLNRETIWQELREFDGEYVNIKWSDKLAEGNNKTFLTEIRRSDFKRVTHIRGGYIDAALVHPVIETTSKDKAYIGKMIYEEYINIQSTDWIFNLVNGINKEPEPSLTDYKITRCDLHSEGENIFTVTVSYDIKTANENSPWYAGNGVISEDGWIKDKFHFVDIEKIGENKYRMITAYTG